LSRRRLFSLKKTIVIDEGIINPMTVARKTGDGFEVTVINGRAARAIKDRRNRSVAELRSLMSKCTKGSLQCFNGVGTTRA
jgi:putative transposase